MEVVVKKGEEKRCSVSPQAHKTELNQQKNTALHRKNHKRRSATSTQAQQSSMNMLAKNRGA